MSTRLQDPIYGIPKSEWGQAEYGRDEILRFFEHADTQQLRRYIFNYGLPWNDNLALLVLAENPDTPPEILTLLANHPDPNISKAAQENLKFENKLELTPEDYEYIAQVVENYYLWEQGNFDQLMSFIQSGLLNIEQLQKLATWHDVGCLPFEEAVAIYEAAKAALEKLLEQQKAQEQEKQGGRIVKPIYEYPKDKMPDEVYPFPVNDKIPDEVHPYPIHNEPHTEYIPRPENIVPPMEYIPINPPFFPIEEHNPIPKGEFDGEIIDTHKYFDVENDTFKNTAKDVPDTNNAKYEEKNNKISAINEKEEKEEDDYLLDK